LAKQAMFAWQGEGRGAVMTPGYKGAAQEIVLFLA
jgi:hypothetical protein